MSELLRIGGALPPTSGRLSFRGPDDRSAFPAPSIDFADFLRLGEADQRALAQTGFRQARVESIRAQIERGDYDTPQRMRAAVERLLDVVA